MDRTCQSGVTYCFELIGPRRWFAVLKLKYNLNPYDVLKKLWHYSLLVFYESSSGRGEFPAGFDLSFGSGINSLLSFGGSMIFPCCQSSFACSIRSFRE